MKRSPFTQPFAKLPNTLPVFPLSNAVLMPGGRLPLNIFEPRYLKMIQDAMRGEQLIGMIQPSDEQSPPSLHSVGCAGRITQYEETDDGRLGVLLVGLCRFSIKEELASMRGYRIVTPSWDKFENDYIRGEEPSSQIRLLFNASLRSYLKRNQIEAESDVLDKLAIEDLANSLLSYLPLSKEDKQILLETDSLENRLIAFTAILDDDRDEPATQH